MRLHRPLLAAALAFSTPAAAAPPEVVVSIMPLHSLIAAVMDGVAQPSLLLEGNNSPHTYTLKPSDAQTLSRADLVFVVGGGLEGFLAKPLTTIGTARVLTMADAPGIVRLPQREGGLWEEDHHDHHHGHSEHEEQGEAFDTHLWLSPANAKAILNAAASALAEVDADNAGAYRRNADEAIADVSALESELAELLAPVQGRPYMVFHDAYHYFEDHFELRPAGAITISPERQPGAKRVKQIRDRIREQGTVCIFREPQFSPQLVERLAGPSTRIGVLDPLGTDLQPGKDAWFSMMRGLAAGLRSCLAG